MSWGSKEAWALSDLAAKALQGQLCPVIGAGASQDLGAPTWRELIGKLAARLVGTPEAHGAIGAEGQWGGADPAVLYDLFELAEGHQVIEEVRRLIYGEHAERSPTDGSAVSSLADLAILSARTCPERRFHVITYNMDSFLEEAIENRDHSYESETSSGPPVRGGREGVRGSVRIFHPHGLLPRDGAPRDLVLSRREYNRLHNAPADRRNLLQEGAFRELCCLFFGFSFSDPNVDRLLDPGLRPSLYRGSGYLLSGTHYALKRARCWEDLKSVTHENWAAIWKDTAETYRLALAGVHQVCAFGGLDENGNRGYSQHRRFVQDLVERAGALID